MLRPRLLTHSFFKLFLLGLVLPILVNAIAAPRGSSLLKLYLYLVLIAVTSLMALLFSRRFEETYERPRNLLLRRVQHQLASRWHDALPHEVQIQLGQWLELLKNDEGELSDSQEDENPPRDQVGSASGQTVLQSEPTVLQTASVRQLELQLTPSSEPQPTVMDTLSVQSQSVVDAWDRVAEGKLLILGQAGAGKTTTLLELATVLAERAAADASQPVPVVFDLSSWQPDEFGDGIPLWQQVTKWLMKELKEHYGVAQDLDRRWVRRWEIVPLLDGFDRVDPKYQPVCLKAINAWLESPVRPLQVAICSRSQAIQRCEAQFKLNAAVHLESLSQKQIQQFLQDINQPQLWPKIQQDEKLVEFVSTPLYLSLLAQVAAVEDSAVKEHSAIAMGQSAIAQMKACHTHEQRKRVLLQAYLNQRLAVPNTGRYYGKEGQPAEPTPAQSQRWLKWLAVELQRQLQTEFLIEHMQPSILSTQQHRLYRRITGLFVGLVWGLVGWLTLGLTVGFAWGVRGGFILGLLWGLIWGFCVDHIEILEALRVEFSRAARWNRLITPIGCSLGIAVLTGGVGTIALGALLSLFWGLLHSRLDFTFDQAMTLIVGISAGFGLLWGLIWGLLISLKVKVNVHSQPNQGIWDNLQNIGIIAVASFPVTVALWQAILVAMGHGFSSMALLGGVAFTLLLASGAGGIACFQHVVLRWLLWRNGNIPWNYARFLGYATERRLMQQVGGGFRFVHDLLREHIAEMDIEKNSAC